MIHDDIDRAAAHAPLTRAGRYTDYCFTGAATVPALLLALGAWGAAGIAMMALILAGIYWSMEEDIELARLRTERRAQEARIAALFSPACRSSSATDCGGERALP